MATIIQLRRDTAANWTSNNPILAEGEPAYETDTLKEKLGDGVTAWNSLPYSGEPGTTTGIENIDRGNFSGVFDVSDGNEGYYEDYIDGAKINEFTLSGTRLRGTKNRVRIKGDLTPNEFPTGWNVSGQPISQSPVSWNEITLLYVKSGDINLVNRVFSIPDTESPTAPTNISASGTTENQTTLNWDASTDDVGIDSYEVYKDGVLENIVSATSVLITELTAGTTYSFSIIAVDTSGNKSDESIAYEVETTTPITVTPADLTNLHIWIDGTDSGEMTLDGENGVLSINDKAGNINLVNGMEAPTFDTDKINFPGTGTLYSSTPSSVLVPTVDFHGFFVFRNIDGTNQDFINNRVDSSNRFAIAYRNGNLSVGYYDGGFTSKSASFSDTANLHKIEFKNIGGVITSELDEVGMNGSQTPFTGTEARFIIGGAYSTQFPQNCKPQDFGTFFVKSGEMTAQERTDMLSYINQKFGI